MTVPRALRTCYLPLLLVLAPVSILARPQDPTEKKAEGAQPDTFFAGTVVEFNSQTITVSRVNLGKTEKRVFRVTADTKYEGKLKTKVRVTVRYVTSEDGETAALIIVRSQQKKTTK